MSEPTKTSLSGRPDVAARYQGHQGSPQLTLSRCVGAVGTPLRISLGRSCTGRSPCFMTMGATYDPKRTLAVSEVLWPFPERSRRWWRLIANKSSAKANDDAPRCAWLILNYLPKLRIQCNTRGPISYNGLC